MRLGPFVERILRAALERPEGQGDAGDLAALVAAISTTVDAHAEAIHVLFEHHRSQDFPAIVKRLERLEASQAVPAIPSLQERAADAVEPAGGAEMPETVETHPRASDGAGEGKQTRQRWTDADDDVLRRIAAEGGTQADAARELGRPSSVVNGKWKTLGLPVPPRKGRKMKR